MLHASQTAVVCLTLLHIFINVFIENNGNNLIEIRPVYDGRDMAGRFG